MSNSQNISVIGYASGKVQGVWFRYFVQQQAQPLGVTGYAKNLNDGRVEVLLCGPADSVARVQQSVASGPPDAWVDNVEWSNGETQITSGFDVL